MLDRNLLPIFAIFRSHVGVPRITFSKRLWRCEFEGSKLTHTDAALKFKSEFTPANMMGLEDDPSNPSDGNY